jgi:ATP-dependent DNA helicase DinG
MATPPERLGPGTSRALLGAQGPLARSFAGYEDREGQLAMADAVERALLEDRTLLCEAGTGTGKTLAYLVPALLSRRKVVISTATKALEEQIFTKDLPLVTGLLGFEPEVALMKGLGNYLCLRRYEELRTSSGAHADPAVRRSLPVLEAWARETETGDVGELVTLPENDPLWREVASSSETRIGAACDHFDACFVTRMKREVERARVVIVNHHLFFADLAVKEAAARRGFSGAGALPPYDAVIFDEAHELEDVATNFFGVRFSRARVDSMLRDADRAFLAGGLADRLLAKGEGTALTAIVREATDRFFQELTRAAGRGVAARVEEGRVTLARDVWSGSVLDAYLALDTALEALSGYAEANAVTEALKLVAARAAGAREDAAKIADPATNQVTWIDVRARGGAVVASPVDLSHMFRERVFERIGSVVLTSATLTANGGFAFLKSRLGLSEPGSVPIEELQVASPFDYGSKSMLYTPRDLPDVAEASFTARAAARVAELVAITRGGAFVLCTSVRSMRAIAAEIRGRVPGVLLVQGDAPKGSLLGRFRADGNAVLVATMSFWEGVDVPGDALRLVIVDRIPFAVPTDPIVAARCAALEEAGRNPFQAYSVPEAAITLKQGFGRLVRTRTDRGVVAILDRRVKTRGYGAALLADLPPAKRTERLDEVAAFWNNLQTSAVER